MKGAMSDRTMLIIALFILLIVLLLLFYYGAINLIKELLSGG